MLDRPEREKILLGVLRRIVDDFDYIIIDCSPSLGLLTVNALTAADSVIIPVQCEYLPLKDLATSEYHQDYTEQSEYKS